jgi:hypothetical protein
MAKNQNRPGYLLLFSYNTILFKLFFGYICWFKLLCSTNGPQIIIILWKVYNFVKLDELRVICKENYAFMIF